MYFAQLIKTFACTAALGAFAVSPAFAQVEESDRDLSTHSSYRSTNIVGMNVRNAEGEDLGSISDLVLDVNKGHIRYAALSFGGLLGIGDKLFAVPWSELKLMHDEDQDGYFVLDVAKEKLKVAPGFDKSEWPNTADPDWSRQIDAFYRQAREDRGQEPAADRVIP